MTTRSHPTTASRPQAGRKGAPGSAQRRVIIEGVTPEIDGGRFPIKRTAGEDVVVEADIFGDGHDSVVAVLKWKHEADGAWTETRFAALGNDRWRASFTVDHLGVYLYTIDAWVDAFGTWAKDLQKREAAGQDVAIALEIGAGILRDIARRARGAERETLRGAATRLEDRRTPEAGRVEEALRADLALLAAWYPERRRVSTLTRELRVAVDPVRARFSAWYEMFPRSAAREPGRHGTFRDCEEHLADIAAMGFDVLYLPPIHPIGSTKRKGKNNREAAQPGDVGSPWAIGAAEGGHKAIHPALGTADDFRRLVARAREHGLEVALDIAFQCSPDHPYVREHPEWFRWRPDGTVQFAENPPKKYEDIYPLNFDSENWLELWLEMKSVFEHWINQGVRIFRVDNPHTKPFPFWEWLLAELRGAHPDVILLSEAFTRPRVMQYLAKIGFNQSYTYFTWRNTRWELEQYMTELTRTEVKEYFRPNFWPNTPDILHTFLQAGGPPAFRIRIVLAATLGSSYGIYGPAFEMGENVAREPGSEEYLNSEKYEIRSWNLEQAADMRGLITRLNRARHEHPALQWNESIVFHRTDNEQLMCYSKRSRQPDEALLTIVNLDPRFMQAGWVELNLDALGMDGSRPYEVDDLLGNGRYQWVGGRNFVQLDPRVTPAHVFAVRQTRAGGHGGGAG